MARVAHTAPGTCIDPNTPELLAAHRQIHSREVRPPILPLLTRGKRIPSDKTIAALSKHIQQELVPDDDDDDTGCSASVLPLSAIEDVVKLLATRVNYGIEYPLTKTPAALCVWRWELNQEHLPFLPKVSREKVDARLADRIQVSLMNSTSDLSLTLIGFSIKKIFKLCLMRFPSMKGTQCLA